MYNYIKKIKKVILIQLLFHILYILTNVAIPYLNKVLFDRVIIEGYSLLFILVICYVIAIFSNSIFQYISQVYEWKTSVEFNKVIKQNLAESILSIDFKKFKEKTVAEYLSVFNNDVEAINEEFLDPLLDIIKSCISLSIYTISLIIFVDWRVAAVIIFLSLCAPIISKYLSPLLTKNQRRFLESLELYTQRLSDILSMKSRVNTETITTFKHLHKEELDKTECSRLKYGKIKTLSNVSNGLVMFVIQLFSFIIVGYLLIKQEITLGAAVATFSYVENFIYPIKNILIDLNLINASKETISILEKYKNSSKTTSAIKNRNHNEIIISNLSYKQDTVNLKDINLHFTAPNKYAIVGKSGVGKSTLLKLIMNHLDLQSGEIHADSNEIFYLTQHEYFMKTTMENNITLFGLYEDKNTRAKHLFNQLSESTQKALQSQNPMTELSGGERNLLGVLRALASDKKILLLDEPTAHLDTKTADIVLNTLLNLEDCLIVFILHHDIDKWRDNFRQIIKL